MIDALILAGFAAWWLITAVYQLHKTPLSRVNWYGFVLDCRFFCPHPIMTDRIAYYATSDDPSNAADALVWRPLVTSDLSRMLPLWHPGFRLVKSVERLADGLQAARETAPPSGAHYTLAYLRLLNLAASASEGSGDRFVRFLVAEHRGRARAERRIVFESRTHVL